MADSTTAKRIGYKQAFKAISIGLAIAYIIMALMAGPAWLFEVNYAANVLFAVLMIYVAGYIVGSLTGDWIITKRRPAVLMGIIGGFLIVWSATLFGSLIGFVKDGLPNESPISEPIHDYIFKPMVLVTMFGFIPIILTGVWFGLSIKRQAAET